MMIYDYPLDPRDDDPVTICSVCGAENETVYFSPGGDTPFCCEHCILEKDALDLLMEARRLQYSHS